MRDLEPIFRPYSAAACELEHSWDTSAICANQRPDSGLDRRVRGKESESKKPEAQDLTLAAVGRGMISAV
jgi:hypothetical protein